MSDKDNSGLPRRKALLTTAGFGASVIGLSNPAMAKDGNNKTKNSRGNSKEDEWVNKNGELDLPQEVIDDFEVTAYDADSGAKRTDVPIYTGKNKNSIPKAERSLVTTESWSDLTYITLYDGSLPDNLGGWTFRVSGGLKYNAVGPSISVDFTVTIGVVELALFAIGISKSESDGICVPVKPPKTVPLELDPCVDLSWSGGSHVTGKFTINVCSADVCGNWDAVDCQVCKNFRFSIDWELSDYFDSL